MKQTHHKSPPTYIRTSAFIFIASLTIIWARLFYLQIVQTSRLRRLSTHNFIRIEKMNAPRGEIVDTHGNILATNKPILAIYWHGTGKHQLTLQQQDLLTTLLQELAIDDTHRLIAQRVLYAERYEKECLLCAQIPFERAGYIAERWCLEPNIVIKSTFKRHYPYKTLACHVIGYLTQQEIEEPGKMGLEKIGNDLLRGEPGMRIRLVNAIGKSLNEEELKTGSAGKTLRTTLDLAIQQSAERAFDTYDTTFDGCLIVMDPTNGALRALISRPGFDPEIFLDPISTTAWQHLQERKPFLNRAWDACYPPASLFKLVSAAAAVEQGIMRADSCRVCPGYYLFRGRKYHCNKHTGHGTLDLAQAVEKSCNIHFFEIGKKISIDTLAAYAHRFGLGKPTGLSIPEKPGFVPTTAWKKEVRKERWWQGETLSAAVGQGYLLVTPLQIARMMSGIFQSTLVSPRVREDEPITREPLNIQPATLTFLRQCLKAVVVEGTGRRVGALAGFNSFAKTGTAQVCSLEHSSNTDLREHAWFACYFSYKNRAPLTLVVLVEHAGGSHAPISIARQFLINYRAYIEGRNPLQQANVQDVIEQNQPLYDEPLFAEPQSAQDTIASNNATKESI